MKLLLYICHYLENIVSYGFFQIQFEMATSTLGLLFVLCSLHTLTA